MTDILDVIDEDNNVVGQAPRREIHEKGLLHREVHVWLFFNNGKILFQRRGLNKDTFPGLLDASVGGYVEMGDSYEDTALREAYEEAGLKIDPKGLIYVATIRRTACDESKRVNNVIRKVYAYRFNGNISDLKVEEGESLGFEAIDIDDLFTLTDEDKKKFASSFGEDVMNVYKKIKEFSES